MNGHLPLTAKSAVTIGVRLREISLYLSCVEICLLISHNSIINSKKSCYFYSELTHEQTPSVYGQICCNNQDLPTGVSTVYLYRLQNYYNYKE